LRVANQRSLGGDKRLKHCLDLGVDLRQLLRTGLLELEPDAVAKVLARHAHHEFAQHELAQAVNLGPSIRARTLIFVLLATEPLLKRLLAMAGVRRRAAASAAAVVAVVVSVAGLVALTASSPAALQQLMPALDLSGG
jgi:hypothetical protein